MNITKNVEIAQIVAKKNGRKTCLFRTEVIDFGHSKKIEYSLFYKMIEITRIEETSIFLGE